MYCSSCGSSVLETARFCSSCGTSILSNLKEDDDFIKLKKEAKWTNCIEDSENISKEEALVLDPKDDIQYYYCSGVPNLMLCIKKSFGSTVYYYTNVKGEPITKQYDYASKEFRNGLSVIRFGGLWGMINDKGEKIVATIYNELEIVEMKSTPTIYFVKVKKGDLYGCLDSNGKVIFDCIYEEIGKFRNRIVGVKIGGNHKFIAIDNVDLLPFYWTNYPEVLGSAKVYFKHKEESFCLDEEGVLFLNVLENKQINETHYPKLLSSLYYLSCVFLVISGLSILGVIVSLINKEEVLIPLAAIKFLYFPTVLILLVSYYVGKLQKTRIAAIWDWKEISFDYINKK